MLPSGSPFVVIVVSQRTSKQRISEYHHAFGETSVFGETTALGEGILAMSVSASSEGIAFGDRSGAPQPGDGCDGCDGSAIGDRTVCGDFRAVMGGPVGDGSGAPQLFGDGSAIGDKTGCVDL